MNRIQSFLAVAALAVTAVSGQAQSKFDGAMRVMLSGDAEASADVKPASRSITGEPLYTVLLRTAPDAAATLADITGADIVPLTSEVAALTATLDEISRVAESDDVIRVSIAPKARPMLNKVRESVHAVQAHAGTGLDQPYDGTGVVAALFDMGVDPNHRAFITDDETRRVKRVFRFNSYDGRYTTYADERVASFSTDDTGETHGTHTMGIMAGSYSGPGRYATVSNSLFPRHTLKEGDLPYCGIAPGAEIVVGCGQGYTPCILTCIREAIAYAEERDMPVVVNLSLGTNTGPHDGTESFDIAMAELAQKAIICISAGNEGDNNASLVKTLTDTDTMVRTFIDRQTASISGDIDIWASDNSPVSASLVIYDTVGDSVVSRVATVDDRNRNATVSSSSTQQRDSVFRSYFSGSVAMSQAVNTVNQRTNIYVRCTRVVEAGSNTSRRYALGIEVAGQPGQRIDFNTESTTYISFNDFDIKGWDDGSGEGSINSMACAEGIITVGSYTTSNRWGTLGGDILMTQGASLNRISSFSSWGKLIDGRQLPTVCAPGEMVTAPVSSYWVKLNRISDNCVADAEGVARATDWYYPLQGTSMSSPAAAGVIALWLQADPSLTSSEVIEIIRQSSATDSYTALAPERFGAGKIDALAGLKLIADNASAGSITADPEQQLVVETQPGQLVVTMLGATSVTARLYTTSGTLAATRSASGNEVELHTATLAPGVYVLAAESNAGRCSRRILIK